MGIKTVLPPTAITLLWCPVCGRDDRYKPFTGKSHFWRGDRCPGQPITRTWIYEDAYNLVVSAVRRAETMIDAYDEDADASAGDLLEDIRDLCQGTLRVTEVAAMREP